MKILRFIKSGLALTALCSLTIVSAGCEYAKMVLGKDKLNQGVLIYNQGRNQEAKEYFKQATEYMPNAAVAWLYYGAALSKDYKNLSGEERDKAANQALEVFKKALDLSGGNCKVEESAMAYISSTYDDLGKEDEWRNWMIKRASSSCMTKEAKATVYHSIAVKYWKCAYDQTTRYADKNQMGKDAFHYRNMDYSSEARADRQKAEDCITKGMEFVEKALALDPEYADVLFYKGLLYREKQKMSKLEAERKQFEAEAKKIADQATEITKRKQVQKTAQE